ncbi:MAG TPA: hypothetical protein VK929_09405 [Longimicrobiales bacterium]|nr:hypothetical protein [Longimicrobiales bacterium]
MLVLTFPNARRVRVSNLAAWTLSDQMTAGRRAPGQLALREADRIVEYAGSTHWSGGRYADGWRIAVLSIRSDAP